MSYTTNTTNRYILHPKKKFPLKKEFERERERERINTSERRTNVTYLVVNEGQNGHLTIKSQLFS